MNNERIPQGNERANERALEELEAGGLERRAELHEALEHRNPENKETSLEDATHEALEQANRVETAEPSAEKLEKPADQLPRYNKRAADVSFKQTMRHTQSQLSAPSRAFSKVIHTKGVERASETLGSTVARPNAILLGAFFAFVLTLAVYLIAKNIGYPLSGFETIGAFVLGWIIGLIFDFLRAMITGKRG